MSDLPSQPRYDIYTHYGRRLIECYHEQQKSKLLPNSYLDSLACGLIPKSSVTLGTPSGDIVPVGILGAGASGLYTALILDSLGIQYEILEASGRTGGRLFTYKFQTGGRYDYFVSNKILVICSFDAFLFWPVRNVLNADGRMCLFS